MSGEPTLVSDGSPIAWAVAQWISSRMEGARTIEGRRAADIQRIAEALAANGSRPPVVLSLNSDRASADAIRALEVASAWLQRLSPIEQRAAGAELIEERRRRREPGAEAIEHLLQSISLTPPPLLGGRRRGRPPGTNPFHGVGLAVCLELLLEPERAWTERDLARAVGSAPSSVNRVFGELERRGYLERKRGASSVASADELRNDLATVWRRQSRTSTVFRCKERDPRAEFLRLASAYGARFALAGTSAVEGHAAILNEPLTIYLDVDDPATVLADSFEPAARFGDLVVWKVPDPAVFLAPRRVQGLPATNRIVTWLDLQASTSERHRLSGDEYWEGTRAEEPAPRAGDTRSTPDGRR